MLKPASESGDAVAKDRRQSTLDAINRFGQKVSKNREEYEREAWRQTKPKTNTPKKSSVPTEREEQVRLAKLLDKLGLLWCSIPNSGHGNYGKQGAIRGARLRAEGLKSGAPDALIFDSPPTPREANPHCKGLAIELKRVKGGKVSEAQERWLSALRERNWEARVCRGFDEALEVLKELGYAK